MEKGLRFGTWDVRDWYWSGSLTTPVRESERLNYIYWVYRRLDGQKGHGKSRGLYFFSMEKETKIIIREQDSLYTTE
jgi:hypothetical protein